MNDYLVLYEYAGDGYVAHVPDLPGCEIMGATLSEAEELINDAIAAYLDVLREDGEPLPEPVVSQAMRVAA